jgi:hypothetical protein
MIKSVVREHHWSPDVINDLFLDDFDFFGLEFWYKDVIETNKKEK